MIASSPQDSLQYWEQFSVQPSDIDYLMGFLVESEQPFTVSELAMELTRFRQEQINDLLKQTLSQGRIYRPRESYKVGEKVKAKIVKVDNESRKIGLSLKSLDSVDELSDV